MGGSFEVTNASDGGLIARIRLKRAPGAHLMLRGPIRALRAITNWRVWAARRRRRHRPGGVRGARCLVAARRRPSARDRQAGHLLGPVARLAGALWLLLRVAGQLRRGRPFGALLALALLVATGGLLWSRFVEPHQLRVVETSIGSTCGVRVALVADLHAGLYVRQDQLEQLVRRLNALDVDAVLVAGDWTYEPSHDLHLRVRAARAAAPSDLCRARQPRRADARRAVEGGAGERPAGARRALDRGPARAARALRAGRSRRPGGRCRGARSGDPEEDTLEPAAGAARAADARARHALRHRPERRRADARRPHARRPDQPALAHRRAAPAHQPQRLQARPLHARARCRCSSPRAPAWPSCRCAFACRRRSTCWCFRSLVNPRARTAGRPRAPRSIRRGRPGPSSRPSSPSR